MRLLVIANSRIPVPPNRYGGTERIVALLSEGLATRGHAVTLMGAQGSRDYGRLVEYPWAGRYPKIYRGYCKLNFMLKLAGQLVTGHDAAICFGRADYLWALLRSALPMIYVFENPIDDKTVKILRIKPLDQIRLVSISEKQREFYPGEEWATIHNAIDVSRYDGSADLVPQGYLAFLGRLTESKGVDLAIGVAKATGSPLRIAGSVPDEPGASHFFDSKVRSELGDQTCVGSTTALKSMNRNSAKWNSKLIAHLEPETSWLGVADVVSVAR